MLAKTLFALLEDEIDLAGVVLGLDIDRSKRIVVAIMR